MPDAVDYKVLTYLGDSPGYSGDSPGYVGDLQVT